MATHSSIVAWRIPWTEEPGGPQSTGSQRVKHGLATKQQQKLQHHLKKDFNLHVSSTFQELGKMPFDTHFLGPHAKVRLER